MPITFPRNPMSNANYQNCYRTWAPPMDTHTLRKQNELGDKCAAAIELIGGAHDGRTSSPTYAASIGLELLNRDDELGSIKRKIFAIQKYKREHRAQSQTTTAAAHHHTGR